AALLLGSRVSVRPLCQPRLRSCAAQSRAVPLQLGPRRDAGGGLPRRWIPGEQAAGTDINGRPGQPPDGTQGRLRSASRGHILRPAALRHAPHDPARTPATTLNGLLLATQIGGPRYLSARLCRVRWASALSSAALLARVAVKANDHPALECALTLP